MADVLSSLLTRDECDGIFKQTFNEDLLDFSIEHFEEEFFGFLGEYYRLVCRGTKGSKKEYFLKSIPIKDEGISERVKKIGVFQKEAALYRTLINDFDEYVDKLPAWHGKCYYSREDLLVMENLDIAGYKTVGENEKFTETRILQTLVALASMHATSIIFEEINGKSISEAYGDYLEEKNFLKKENGWWTAGINLIKAIAQQHPRYQSLKYQQYLEETFMTDLDQIYEILKTSKQFKNTFCHRDIWGQNILFKEDSCKFVDFQNCRYCLPAIDFLMVLHCNTQCRQEREQLKDKCVKFYYEQLESFCAKHNICLREKAFSLEEFIESCNYALLLPLVVDAVYKPLTKTPPGLFAELKVSDPAKYVSICENDRTDFILDLMTKDSNYQDIMNEIVEDIVNHVYPIENQNK
ncbi:hypothetical protein ACFFRR_004965 [Megaselia abdita]